MSDGKRFSDSDLKYVLDEVIEAGVRRESERRRGRIQQTPPASPDTYDLMPIIAAGVLLIALICGFIALDLDRIADAVAASEALS